MWKNLREKTKGFLLDTFFPRFCLNCQKEGNYLCEDCVSLLEISEHQYCLCQKPNRLFKAGKCPRCRKKFLSGLYFALPYQNVLVKNLIQRFKYEPFIKELAKPLASLIIDYFQLSVNPPDFYREKSKGRLYFNSCSFGKKKIEVARVQSGGRNR